MTRLRNVVVAAALIFSAVNAWCGEYVNPKSSTARQKENDWVMIERYRDVKMTPEEYYDDKDMVKMVRDAAQMTGTPANIHMLYVKVQFLKKCDATTISKMSDKEELMSPMFVRWTSISAYIFGYGTLMGEGKKEEAETYRAKTLKTIPDLDEMVSKYYLFPLYDCSYKTKINVTYFYASGSEMKTESQYPVATGTEGDKRKLTVFPGDTVNVSFTIPHGVETWDVWVSK